MLLKLIIKGQNNSSILQPGRTLRFYSKGNVSSLGEGKERESRGKGECEGRGNAGGRQQEGRGKGAVRHTEGRDKGEGKQMEGSGKEEARGREWRGEGEGRERGDRRNGEGMKREERRKGEGSDCPDLVAVHCDILPASRGLALVEQRVVEDVVTVHLTLIWTLSYTQ